jgi:site-specific recombinase XerD
MNGYVKGVRINEAEMCIAMGHADVKTTEIYTHVMVKDASATISPLDSM